MEKISERKDKRELRALKNLVKFDLLRFQVILPRLIKYDGEKMGIVILPNDEHDKLKLGWVMYEGQSDDPLGYDCDCLKCIEGDRIHKEKSEKDDWRCQIQIVEGHRAIMMRPHFYPREKIEEMILNDPEDFPQEIIDKIWELKEC